MTHVIAATVALLIGVAGFSSALAQEATPPAGSVIATASPTRTNTRYFLPFSADGLNASLNRTTQENGTCDQESVAAPGRPDAWNCVGATSNEIYDPCFQNPFSTPDEPGELVCVDSPFTRDVVMLAATRPLPVAKDESGAPAPGQPKGLTIAEASEQPLPWALELVSGQQCTLAPGATAVFAGMRVNYFCSDGGSVLGAPDRTLPLWVVNYLPEGEVASQSTEVAVAWL